MRARVIVTDAPTETLEAGIQLTRDVLVPAARAREGYRGYVALVDPDSGRSLAITLWEDEATEAASDEASRQGREEAATAFGVTIAGIEKYDVPIAELS